MQPAIKLNQDKQYILDYLKIQLPNEFSGNLISSSIKIKDNATLDSNICFEINSSISNPDKLGVIVKDKAGKIITAKLNLNGLLSIDNSGELSETNNFVKAYYSKEFSSSGTECGSLIDPSNYTVSSSTATGYAFEKKIIETINNYTLNYDGLKKELNVPEGTDFSFRFIYANNSEIKTPAKNISTDVYSETSPIIYVNNQANISTGLININVW